MTITITPRLARRITAMRPKLDTTQAIHSMVSHADELAKDLLENILVSPTMRRLGFVVYSEVTSAHDLLDDLNPATRETMTAILTHVENSAEIALCVHDLEVEAKRFPTASASWILYAELVKTALLIGKQLGLESSMEHMPRTTREAELARVG